MVVYLERRMMGGLDERICRLLTKKVPLEPSRADFLSETSDSEGATSSSKPTVSLYPYGTYESLKMRNSRGKAW